MNENPFEQAKEFDRLEELVASGATLNDPEVGNLSGELAVIQLLIQDAADLPMPMPMPRQDQFRRELMGKLKRRKSHGGLKTILAMAATFLVAFLSYRGFGPNQGESAMVVDNQQATLALDTLNRDDMVAYLTNTEHLLMSIRDSEMVCTDEGADMALERNLARNLLLKQKRFTNALSGARYNQARKLFANLESILVDVRNLDPCTDPMDLELINDHISSKRILGKLRLIAQEIQMS